MKVFVVFLTYSDGYRHFYNIYPNMVKAIEEAEKAIKEDEGIDSALLCYDMITPTGRRTIKTYTVR